MRHASIRWTVATGLSLAVVTARLPAGQEPPAKEASATRVVLLGTGNPGIDPDRSGPATAVVVNDTSYLVDFGPGVIRRAKAAVLGRGIKALEPTNLRVAFVTHLHSDHTVGYPDLIFTPWTVGRRVPLEIYGPKGLKAMTEHLLEAYRVDIETRTNADGYRFDTPDRSIVISGDTNPARSTIDACRGGDVLIHEVITPGWLASRPETFHSTVSPEELHSEMRARYGGHFVIGRDLDVY